MSDRMLGMLDERRALAFSYDAGADVATVTFAHDGLDAGSVRATLLVDARGYLVGVDMHARTARTVVMLGSHEDVARTIDTSVEIVKAQDGRELRIASARDRVRAHEPSPYL
jgi:hypothetical protein